MSPTTFLAVLLVLSFIGYYLGRGRVLRPAFGGTKPHSLPSYYGWYVALWAGVPTVLLLVVWLLLGQTIIDSLVMAGFPEARLEGLPEAQVRLILSEIKNVAFGAGFTAQDPDITAAAAHMSRLDAMLRWAVTLFLLALGAGAIVWSLRSITPAMRARLKVEAFSRRVMLICSLIAIAVTVAIVLSLFFESLRFFALYSPIDFLFGLQWSPQTAIREDQVGSSGAFGAIPVFAGTLLISAIAMAVAVPVGLMSAIYLSEYAARPVRSTIKPILEILAGIPTVVYGFFAVLTVAPFIARTGNAIGLDIAANSALAAGVVMGVMIIPFVSSLSDDVMNAVPQSLRDGAAGLGATRSEMIRQVVLPAALPGIVGAVLLAVSRAIGETMIVVMAAGLAANLTANPFEAVTTVTVQIVANLTGDTSFDSAKTLSAFALGLTLFVVTLFLNIIALRVVKKYREKYD